MSVEGRRAPPLAVRARAFGAGLLATVCWTGCSQVARSVTGTQSRQTVKPPPAFREPGAAAQGVARALARGDAAAVCEGLSFEGRRRNALAFEFLFRRRRAGTVTARCEAGIEEDYALPHGDRREWSLYRRAVVRHVVYARDRRRARVELEGSPAASAHATRIGTRWFLDDLPSEGP